MADASIGRPFADWRADASDLVACRANVAVASTRMYAASKGIWGMLHGSRPTLKAVSGLVRLFEDCHPQDGNFLIKRSGVFHDSTERTFSTYLRGR